MNLWLRLFRMLIMTLWRPRLTGRDAVSTVTMRVWPNDLDLNVHMNNGRYLSCADIGRMDLLVRSGLLRMVAKHGWRPIMSGVSIRYRRELKPFQKFTIETRMVSWQGRTLVMEHLFITEENGKRDIAARELVAAGFYQRAKKQFVEADKVMRTVGVEDASPEPGPDVAAFLSSFETLKLGWSQESMAVDAA